MYKGKTDWAAYHGLKSEVEQKMSPGEFSLYDASDGRWLLLMLLSPSPITGRQFAMQFQTENAKIIRVRGITKVHEEDFDLEKYQPEEDQAVDNSEKKDENDDEDDDEEE